MILAPRATPCWVAGGDDTKAKGHAATVHKPRSTDVPVAAQRLPLRASSERCRTAPIARRDWRAPEGPPLRRPYRCRLRSDCHHRPQGLLGAGNTTLLNALVRRRRSQTPSCSSTNSADRARPSARRGRGRRMDRALLGCLCCTVGASWWGRRGSFAPTRQRAHARLDRV